VFEGFKFEYVDVGDATLRVRHGGDGPPVCPARHPVRTVPSADGAETAPPQTLETGTPTTNKPVLAVIGRSEPGWV
jgi:hypothetical protein